MKRQLKKKMRRSQQSTGLNEKIKTRVKIGLEGSRLVREYHKTDLLEDSRGLGVHLSGWRVLAGSDLDSANLMQKQFRFLFVLFVFCREGKCDMV